MKNKNTVGIGIVGVGSGIASVYLAAYKLVGNNKIVAVCDTNTKRGIEIARKYGAFFTDDYEEMLNYPGIDIINIFSPDNFHYQHIISAAQRGYNTLCTKPMAMSVEEAVHIKEVVEKTGIKFMVGMCNRWKPYHRKIKELISSGTIGEPVFISYKVKGAFYNYPEDSFYRKKESIGQFLHNGVHYVDEICDFFDSVPKKVYGVTTSYFPPDNILETPNYHLANIEMDRGGIAKIEYNELLINPPTPELSLNIFIVGTKGSIEYSHQENEGLLHLKGKEIINIDFPDEYFSLYPFVKLVEHFLDCVRKNHNPVISLDVSVKVLQTCLGVIESASIEKPVVIE